MRILALDLSKSSTGWALWGPDDEKVRSGAWELGTVDTPVGMVFAALHRELMALHKETPIEAVFWEQPRHLANNNMQSNVRDHFLLVGLAAHAASFAAAKRCRIARDVNIRTWRRHFLGKIHPDLTSTDLKDLAKKRARELGFLPESHDEAEAIGILDYACEQLGLSPYWYAQAALRLPWGALT